MGTFDDNAAHGRARRPSAASPFTLDPPRRRRRAAAPDRALPLRAGRSRPARAGLLRGLQHPGRGPRAAAAGDRRCKKVVIGVSGGLEFDPCADRRGRAHGPARPAAQRTFSPTPCPASRPASAPRPMRSRLMQALGVTVAEIDIRPAARQMLGDHRPSVRRRRAGLRRHLRERAGGPAHRLSVPPRQPARRHRARHRRSVRAGAGLVHLWRRRSDVALQRQRRRAQDPDPASDPLGDRRPGISSAGVGADAARASSPPRSRRSWCRSSAGETPQSTEANDRPLRAAGFQPVLHAALRLPPVEDRVPGAGTPGAIAERGDWPPGFPERAAPRL